MESTAVRSITHRIERLGLTPAPEQRVLHCTALQWLALAQALAAPRLQLQLQLQLQRQLQLQPQACGAQSSRQRARAAAAMAGDSCSATLTARRCVPLFSGWPLAAQSTRPRYERYPHPPSAPVHLYSASAHLLSRRSPA